MADSKISALTALTGAGTADDDLIPVVDTSATQTKKQTFTEHLAKLVLMTWAFASDITVNGITIGRGQSNFANNTFVGAGAGLTDGGEQTVGIGVDALRTAGVGGTHCVAVGYKALREMTAADGNTALGSNCLQRVTTGSANTGLGDACANFLTTGEQNTLVGEAAGQALVVGNRNTIVGCFAFANGNDGSDNTAVGHNALVNLSGSGNTVIGAGAGDSITTGDRNIVIGKDADTSAATADDEFVIGDATFATANVSAAVATASTHRLRVRLGTTVYYALLTNVA